jgi:nucleoside-diphosphate-sugar epimerase
MTSWLVIGAGYTGERVASALVARGDEVTVTRRHADTAAEVAARTGARGLALDLASAGPDELAAAVGAGANIVVTAPPSDPAGAAEARFAAAASRACARRIVYVSSTGVYAAAGGAWVDEDFATTPLTTSGRARLAAETALAAGAVPCVRLRAAGIHGPGRGVVARMRAGTYRIIGGGDTQVSRVHVDDLVAAVVLAGDAAAPGPVYNVADDAPCTSNQLATAVATALGLPRPPSVPLDAVDPDVAGMFSADRRIDNRRLKQELGWVLLHPTWQTSIHAPEK